MCSEREGGSDRKTDSLVVFFCQLFAHFTTDIICHCDSFIKHDLFREIGYIAKSTQQPKATVDDHGSLQILLLSFYKHFWSQLINSFSPGLTTTLEGKKNTKAKS